MIRKLKVTVLVSIVSSLLAFTLLLAESSWADQPLNTPPPLKFNLSQLQEESASIANEIEQAKVESARYNGGWIKSVIESRIATSTNTLTIFEQLINKIQNPTKPEIKSPKVQGLPDGTLALENDIQSLDEQISKTQLNADRYNGGLIRAQLLSNKAIMQNTRAMKLQKLLDLSY